MRSTSVNVRVCRWGLHALLVFMSCGSTSLAKDWPQWLGANRDGVWRETGLLQKFPATGPKVLWRTPIGSGYSGPSVANNRVYVMDRQRAKDEKGLPIRPSRDGIPGNERILCLEADTGKIVWKHEYPCPYRVSYPSGPRNTPLVHDGRVYTQGAMGNLLCLDAARGVVHWSRSLCEDYKTEPPVWGYAAHPLLDGDLLFCTVGGEGSAVVAVNKDTGKEVWKALTTEEVGYSPPMIYEAAGKKQLIIWLSEAISSLDPATGKVYWSQKYPTVGPLQRPAVNIITVPRSDNRLFLSTYYHGPMMLELASDKPAASILWQGKSNNVLKPDGLHSLMSTPVIKNGYIYGVCANGELRCLEEATGKQLWETYAATGGKKTDCGNAFLVPQGDRFVLFNDLGELILAELTPQAYREIDRAHVLETTESARGRIVVWSHPAFANRCVYVRNDKEILCLSLAAEG